MNNKPENEGEKNDSIPTAAADGIRAFDRVSALAEASARVAEPVPSVGRIVHYREYGNSEPVAAIVTRVWGSGPDAMINLVVFIDSVGGQPRTSVPFNRDVANGWGWSWPPRA